MRGLLREHDVTRPAYDLHALGHESHPLLVIDNFVDNPETLIALAEDDPPFTAQSTDYYPGIRKPAPADYSTWLAEKVEPLLHQIFDLPLQYRPVVRSSVFSLTTTPPKQLRPIQCVPHIDNHVAHQFAVVHYLCDEKFGGTSFYRHRSTGYESVTTERLAHYFKILKQEVMADHQAQRDYINGNTHLFERIARIGVRFNRALIYRSCSLHSGDISASVGLSSDPRQGRLTLNSFIESQPRYQS